MKEKYVEAVDWIKSNNHLANIQINCEMSKRDKLKVKTLCEKCKHFKEIESRIVCGRRM